MTTCDTDILSSYLDGELGEAERARVEFHLTGCADCRDVIADLGAITEIAPALTAIASRPAADLWPGVLSRIRPARTRAVSLSWMQAIAAGLLLAVLSGGGVWLTMRGNSGVSDAPAVVADRSASGSAVPVADFGDAAFESAVKDLREALENGRNRLDAQTIQVLETNLAAIDRAIAEARAALAADPANVSLNNYLAGVRRRKLDLLRTAGELAQPAL